MCLCRSQYLMLAVVVLLGLATLLGGCGAKGNLYLPEGERQQKSQPPAAPSSLDQPTQQP